MTKSSQAFFAKCNMCQGIGLVLIPDHVLDEKSIKELHDLEEKEGLDFECQECSKTSIDMVIEESGIESIPKWVKTRRK